MKQDMTRRGFFGLGGTGLSLGLVSWPFSAKSLLPSDEIILNQVGYLTRGPKQIVVHSDNKETRGLVNFDLIEYKTDRLVKSATVRIMKTSDDAIGTADLFRINKPGAYCLRSGDVTSLPFRVSEAPFDEAQRVLTRAFYLQRCGVALDDRETGLVHAACHHQDALSKQTRQQRNCVGGWHDAGDFGKYVATTSIVIGELLSLYEETPTGFRDGGLGIPESGDGEPDLLSEMQIGLDWLLKMQRPSGAFERKISGNDWPSMTAPPEDDTQERFTYGASTADTAKAAAALGIAARVFDTEKGERYREAAEKAWHFLEEHPLAEVEETPGDDSGSGSYLAEDRTVTNWDGQDRFWAALELYVTTGKKVYAAAVRQQATTMYIWPATWSNPSLIGLMNYLRIDTRDDIASLRSEIKYRLVERANEYEKTARLSPWGVATLDFEWGSNREVATRGRILAAAYRYTGEDRFSRAAISQVDYLFGKNPVGYSFVTGIGSNAVQNPHHRFDLAVRSGEASHGIPGLLVGGPNRTVSDGDLASTANIGRYRDDATSWETNEFAIDHNAALLSLLGRLSLFDLQQPRGIIARIRRRLNL